MYNELVKIDSDNAEFLSRRGYCNRISGFLEDALKDYNSAILNSPNRHNLYSNRGQLFLDMKDYSNAVLDYTKASELINGKNPKYLNNRGWAYYKLNKLTKACQDFETSKNMNFALAAKNYEKYCE